MLTEQDFKNNSTVFMPGAKIYVFLCVKILGQNFYWTLDYSDIKHRHNDHLEIFRSATKAKFFYSKIIEVLKIISMETFK